MLVVATFSTAREFGALSLLYAVLLFTLAVGRTTIGEASLGGLWVPPQVARATAMLAALATFLMVAIGLLVAHNPPWLVGVATVAAISTAAQDQCRLAVIREGKPGWALASDAAWLVAASLSQAAVLAFDGAPAAATLLAGYLVAAPVALAVFAARMRPGIGRDVWVARLPRGTIRIAAANVSGAVLLLASAVLIAHLAGQRTLGYIQTAQLLATPLSLTGSLLPALLLPRLVGGTTRWDPRRLRRLVLSVSAALAAVSWLAVLAFGAAAFPLLTTSTLLGVAAVVLAQNALTVGTMFNYLYLRAASRDRAYVRARLSWGALTIIALPLGAGFFGLEGVLTALSLCTLVEYLVTAAAVRAYEDEREAHRP